MFSELKQEITRAAACDRDRLAREIADRVVRGVAVPPALQLQYLTARDAERAAWAASIKAALMEPDVFDALDGRL
jgi:hypothetical protein